MIGEEAVPSLVGPVVIDASVVVEYLVVLEHADAATTVFRRVEEGRVDVWAPDLVYPESVSAFRKLVRLGFLHPPEAERAVSSLVELPITTTGSGALMAAAWSMRDFLTPYDACYVALAGEMDAPFLTAERDLALELRQRGRRTLHLGEL